MVSRAKVHEAIPVEQPIKVVRKQSATWSRIRQNWQLYALLALPVLYLIVFKYVPIIGAQIAFRDFSPVAGLWNSPWVGLDNFTKFINSPQFGNILGNTLRLSIYSLPVGFFIPIVLALSLNQVRLQSFQKAVQLVVYAPYFISVTVLVGLVTDFLHPRLGIFAMLGNWLGFQAPNLMGDSNFFDHIYVWSGIWQTAGFGSVIYLAILSTIDPALHEAAIVDGANRLQRIWYIDIPGLLPTAVVLLVLSTGNILQIGFEKIYLMQNSLNIGLSEVIDTYVYRVGLLSSVPAYSYATAIGLFKSVIGLVLIVMVNRAAKTLTKQSLW